MDIIDIGANLTHSSFRHDLDEVIADAAHVGVKTIIVTGASDEGNVQALELARKYPGHLFATAGVHPHHAAEYNDTSRELILEHARYDEVVAIGETGLDYNRNYSPHPSQKTVFESQLQIAAELHKPVFMHLRDAYDDFVAILKKYRDRLPAAVAHCFTGSERELDGLLDLDLHIGITGWICDERRGHHLHELIDKIPANRLMLETDAPYLLPRDLENKPRDRRNVPANLLHIVETVARLLDKPTEQVALETTNTARSFFGLNA